MIKWFNILKQDIMNNIRRLFENSDIDFDIKEVNYEIRVERLDETILSEAFEVKWREWDNGHETDFVWNPEFYTEPVTRVRGSGWTGLTQPIGEFEILIVHPEEGKFVFRELQVGIQAYDLWPLEYAQSDAEAIQMANEKIRNIEERNRGSGYRGM